MNNSYRNITTATTTTVKSGSGRLKRIVFNKGVASGTIAIHDAVTAVAPLIGTLTLAGILLNDAGRSIEYDCAFGVGLTIVTSQATDITVIYS
jgi:hypothetical protein